MDRQDVALGVISKISGHATAAIRPEMELVGELGIDSPKALQLLVALEDELSIEISDEDAARMDTVRDVLDYLSRSA